MPNEQQTSEVHEKGPLENRGQGEQKKEEVVDDFCRCKEVSKKTVPEMLRLMVSDLAFWRRSEKKK